MHRLPRQRSVRLRDLILHYLDWEARAPQTSWLLLVHPNATSSLVWQPFVDRTTWAGRCIAPDLRGHGDTSTGERDNSVDVWADDLAALIEHLGVGPAVVVGGALGATASLLLATRYPELVSGVVANDTAFDIEPELLRRVQRRIRDQGWQPSVEAAMAGYHAADHWEPHLRQWFIAAMFETEGEGVRWRYDADAVARVMDPRPQSLLDEVAVRCPVLLLRGEHSGPLTVESFERLATRIPSATALTIPSADHVLTLDAPEEYAAAVDGFLTGLA